jgi:hypothetical protein
MVHEDLQRVHHFADGKSARVRGYYAASEKCDRKKRIRGWDRAGGGDALERGDHRQRLRAGVRDDYKHSKKLESNASIHFQTILLNQQAVVGFTERRLDLGPWQFIQFVELDGTRPKRVLVKVMGE